MRYALPDVEAELLLGSPDVREGIARQLGDLEAVLDLDHRPVHSVPR